MPNLIFYRLLQLINPNLPIGGFTYSQGIEWAVEAHWVKTKQEAYQWLDRLLENSLATFDLPIMIRLYQALQAGDLDDFLCLSALAYAGRETKELRLEDSQSAEALIRVLRHLDDMTQVDDWQILEKSMKKTVLAPFVFAAYQWNIPLNQILAGFLWNWLENRVACLVKVIPLGQTEGQWLLHALSNKLEKVTEQSWAVDDDSIGSAAYAAVIASCQHETQYCRLFRS